MVRRMDIVIVLFDRFEPLDAIGPYEILAHIPGAKVRFAAPEAGRVTDVLGSLPVDVPARCSDVELADETTAQAIQLYTEYDPQPPFDSGSMAKASPEVLERARALG